MLNLLLVIGGALLGTGALIQSAGVGTGAKGLAIGFASAGGVLLWLLSLIYGTAIVVLVIVAMAQGAVWRGLWLLLGSVISVIMAAALVAAGIIVGPRLVESRRAAATASAQAEARIAESADAAAAAATRDQILAEAARAPATRMSRNAAGSAVPSLSVRGMNFPQKSVTKLATGSTTRSAPTSAPRCLSASIDRFRRPEEPELGGAPPCTLTAIIAMKDENAAGPWLQWRVAWSALVGARRQVM